MHMGVQSLFIFPSKIIINYNDLLNVFIGIGWAGDSQSYNYHYETR